MKVVRQVVTRRRRRRRVLWQNDDVIAFQSIVLRAVEIGSCDDIGEIHIIGIWREKRWQRRGRGSNIIEIIDKFPTGAIAIIAVEKSQLRGIETAHGGQPTDTIKRIEARETRTFIEFRLREVSHGRQFSTALRPDDCGRLRIDVDQVQHGAALKLHDQ